jgi:hypothetical protein
LSFPEERPAGRSRPLSFLRGWTSSKRHLPAEATMQKIMIVGISEFVGDVERHCSTLMSLLE